MSVRGRAEAERVERRLRELVAAGRSLEGAVQVVYWDDGLGALWICPAVEVVGNLSPQEAKRLVVRTLSPMWHG
jgi:hypothetical protein